MTGYIEKEKELKGKGIDEVIVLSVNDPYVMNAWQKGFGADTQVTVKSRREVITCIVFAFTLYPL